MVESKLKVSTYSGYKSDERPTAFTLAERTFQVREIVDRWYGEDHAYFKLIADGGNLYIIRHDGEIYTWEFVMTETLWSEPALRG
jgi:hypothetical protein